MFSVLQQNKENEKMNTEKAKISFKMISQSKVTTKINCWNLRSLFVSPGELYPGKKI